MAELDTQVFSQEDAHMRVDSQPNSSNQVWCRLITKNNSITYELIPIEPDSEGRHNLVSLGRAEQCDIRFNTSPRISNRHCIIFCKMNRQDPTNPYLEAWIEDTSANGTFLNKGQKLQKNVPRLLRTGDEISLINPELVRLPALNITEDVVQSNSFVVILDLPVPNQNTRANTVTRRQEMLGNLQRGLVRSNTVIRLLDQQRNIYDYYDVRELIGTGAAGHVYRGIKKDTGQEWAIKQIDTRQMADQDASAVTKEAELLRSIHHPNVMRLEDIFAQGHTIYLVMELSNGGDLFERIIAKSRYSEAEAKQVMSYILDAMKCLHEFNIAHRDLKPENILLPHKHDDTWVKITDFGLAKVIDEKGTKTYCGTPQYFAPEVMERKFSVNKAGSYSLAADVWSCGCILYVLLIGVFPFHATNDRALYQCIRKGMYNTRHPAFASLSPEAKDLLTNILNPDPEQRITAARALQHPWFASLRQQSSASSSSSAAAVAAPPSSSSSNHQQGQHDSMVMSVVSEVPPASQNLMPPPAPVPHGRQTAASNGTTPTTKKKHSVMSALANDITAMDVIDPEEKASNDKATAAQTPSPAKRSNRRTAMAAVASPAPAASTTTLTGKRKRQPTEEAEKEDKEEASEIRKSNNTSPRAANKRVASKK